MKGKHSILFQAKAKLAKMLKLEFATITTDDGQTYYVDGEAVAGANIYEYTEGGDYVAAPDGEIRSGGKVYLIANGVITSVTEGGDFQDAEDILEAPEAIGDDVSVEEHNELVEVVNEILDVVKEQDGEIAELAEAVVMLETELRKAKGETKAEPAQKTNYNRDKRFDFADQKMKNLIKNFKE